MGGRTSEMVIESAPNLIYSKGKSKISIKSLKKKKMVIATKFGFRSTRLCKRNVLAPITSDVLNENHLVSFANRIFTFVISFLLVIKSLKGKGKKILKIVFY